MRKQVYGTYRAERLLSAENYADGISRNGVYHPATYLNNQFADWNAANLTNVVEPITDERYTGILPVFKDGVPTGETVPKLTRFLFGEYEDAVVDPVEFGISLANVGAKWDIQIFSAEEAKVWIRANTNLVEEEEGKFLVSEETTDMMGNTVPAKYLVIA